ncbi:hemolysin family protein [Rhodopirellula sp.]|nr:hemolysin family protein [Rhodopirellula sp.]MDB4423258.1 hemolysin family protein [Rhodopirellula sp.]
MNNILYLSGAFVLIILNGFFVAAEFALVKVRLSRIDQMVREKRAFATTAQWLAARLDKSLSACQLGITMASLGLGWVGEPAFSMLIEPVFVAAGITDPDILHWFGFGTAFLFITALHLVVGEQFPKIYAIRRPETMLLWCAAPLRFFYIILYPSLAILNETTALLLKMCGITGASEHDGPTSESEVRDLITQAHRHGYLSRNEHSLINNVFEFDDMLVRRVMVPRGEVSFFDINDSLPHIIEQVQRTKHTRYPVCNGSLDDVVGVAHIKDLLGIDLDSPDFKIQSVMRPPKKVHETMPISLVLRHFQATHQLLSLVLDEFGSVTGVVTLENVLERIIGSVEDEFDTEQPNIIPSGPGEFILAGSTGLEEARRELHIPLNESDQAETISGLLMDHQQKILKPGDTVQLEGATAEVMEVRSDHASKIHILLTTEVPKNLS